MKKMKIVALLTTILSVSLAGCSGDTTSNTSASTNASTAATNASTTASTKENKEPSVITIAARGGSHVDAMNLVKEKFETQNNVKIEILGLESDDLKQKISLDSKNSKGAYDLIMADDPWMPEFTEANIFENLTKLGVKEDTDFMKQGLDLGKAPYGEGDLYALPFSGNVQFFFYNKELLNKSGESVPESWEKVLKIASDIKTKEGKPGYVIRGEQGNPIVSDFLPVLWAFGGDVMDSNFKGTMQTKEAKDALEMYIALLKVGANYNKNDIVSSVSEGKAAMSLGWPSWYISKEGSKADFANIPSKSTESSSAKSTGMIGNWMMGVTANSQNKELAKEFLVYITSAETQKTMMEKGGVPTRISVCNDTELLSQYPYLKTLKTATQNSVARPRTPKWSEIEVAVGAELSAVVAGSKSIDDGLKASNEAINTIMK